MTIKSTGGLQPFQWQRLINGLRESKNPLEREAVYFGTVAADGSPILVDRSQFREHVHFLGPTGGGKSSRGLAPLIEQLVSFGDSTIFIIDLKGDKNELLAAASVAREQLMERRGINLPIRHFTIENGKATVSFNPLASPEWLRLTPLQRTEVLAGAGGLIYGSEYGTAFFTAANTSVIYAAEQHSAGERNFRSIHNNVAHLLLGRGGHDLPRELRQAGVHAYEVLTRFASIEQLNLPPESPSEISFADCFRTPQILYFKFPSTVSQTTSSAVARLATYFLTAAANAVQNRCQVYLVIDEFQRMAAENLSILFEQARSLDISLILSNQSIQDLGKRNSSLLNVVETNCNTRQWFSVGSRTDIQTVETLGCHREKIDVSLSFGANSQGAMHSETYRSVQVPRISTGDVTYVSNHPDLSILQITGVRRGYSQYRGLPFVARTRFHITQEEYQRRCQFAWPELSEHMVIAKEGSPPSLAGDKRQRKTASVPVIEAAPTASSQIEFSDWTPEGF